MAHDHYQDLEGQNHGHKQQGMSKLAIGGIVLLCIAGISTGIAVGASKDSAAATSDSFVQAVRVENVMNHLRRFDELAKENGGSRSVATGYNASAEYVMDQLQQTNHYDIFTQPLVVPVEKVFGPPGFSAEIPLESGPATFEFTNVPLERSPGLGSTHDFSVMLYGATVRNFDSGMLPVAVIPNYGCDAADYSGIPSEDFIALINLGDSSAEGNCDPYIKALAAETASPTFLKAMVLHLDEDTNTNVLPFARVRKRGWLNGDAMITKPSMGASWSVAQLLQTPNAKARVQVDGEVTFEHTYNVCAETRTGNPDQVILPGAHLDSVPDGPGLNDNGSGSAMLLELALQLARTIPEPANKVRFCWWAAEEIGLLGSYHYVDRLSQEELDRIALNLNFDMMGSANGIRGVHSAELDQVPPGTEQQIRDRSNMIRDTFGKHFDGIDQAWQQQHMLGGSDYLPFILKQIPAGGLATGASGRKTEDERLIYGGLANANHDPCYHQPCDTVENIGQDFLADMSAAAARVLGTYALTSQLWT